MIKQHITFLYTEKMNQIVWTITLIYFALLYTISEYKEETSLLLFYREQYTQEYIAQGFYVLKFILLLFITYEWIYATKLSSYNVYMFQRYPPQKVLYTKAIALFVISLRMMVVLCSLFVIMWTLYPTVISIPTVISLFINITIWVALYHMLCWMITLYFSQVFSLMLPLIGYITGMILMDTNTALEITVSMGNYIQLFTPDVLYHNNLFILLFGPYVELSTIVVGLLIIHRKIKRIDLVFVL